MSIPRGKREGVTGCKPSYPLRAESASVSAGDADALRQAAVTGHRAINESGTVEQPLRLSCLRAWEAFSVLHEFSEFCSQKELDYVSV